MLWVERIVIGIRIRFIAHVGGTSNARSERQFSAQLWG